MKFTLKKISMRGLSGIIFIFVGMVLIASIVSPYFLTVFNLQSVLRDLAFIGMIGIGQSLLLLLGELDLSVGNIASLCGILCGMMMVNIGWNPWLSLIIGILLGTVLGMINGVIISKLRLNSMVATIGMSGVYSGVNLVLTRGQAITKIPGNILFLGKANIGILPVPTIITICILLLILFLVYKTKFGRHIYAIGNNIEASKILGVKVDRVRIFAYGIVGTISAVAGVIYVARLGTAQASIGTNWPMNSIASCVIGGVSLTGGVGNPLGALIGAAMITVIQNMIVIFGVNMYWQAAVSGFIVVVAISLSSISEIVAAKRERFEQMKNLENLT